MSIDGAELVVRCLEAHDVKFLFTLPGASIDPILNALVDHGPEIVLCHHEQNAGFMAQGWGRLTGDPGVCLATAGPGLTNLVTAVATADAERCPLIAITGQVGHNLRFKRAHQNVDAVSLFRPITKWSVEVDCADVLPDILANAFRIAREPREGAVHISIPIDVLNASTEAAAIGTSRHVTLGTAPSTLISRASDMIDAAKNPVILLGLAASKPWISDALCSFMRKLRIPIAGTFEAAGAVPRDLDALFMGRLGVFRNQPGDPVVADADCLICIGFDPVEYDPTIWNKGLTRSIIHIDNISPTIDKHYRPDIELIGSIRAIVQTLETRTKRLPSSLPSLAQAARTQLERLHTDAATITSSPVHPARLVHEIRQLIDDSVTVVSDVGSHQYWMARNFFCYEPRHFLTSMGFQTMGVSLPWALVATLARPGTKVLSVSGDGSFLMCSMELETAVRLNAPLVHLVWEDHAYDLVKIQEEQKYGRNSAACFGGMDIVAYAESFGACGMRINHTDQIRPILQAALEKEGPVVISVPVDYSHNRAIVDATL